jgi:hypothetical protein
MGVVINLNQVRKARAKAEAEKQADTNRVLHGTPKAEKKKSRSEKKKSEKQLEGKRLEDKDE